MGRKIWSGLFLAGLIFTLDARADPDTHQRRLRQELNLTEQQAEEVRKIFEDNRSKLESLRRQRQEIAEQMRERMKAVLTPEQLQKFDQMREDRRAQRQGRPLHRDP